MRIIFRRNYKSNNSLRILGSSATLPKRHLSNNSLKTDSICQLIWLLKSQTKPSGRLLSTAARNCCSQNWPKTPNSKWKGNLQRRLLLQVQNLLRKNRTICKNSKTCPLSRQIRLPRPNKIPYPFTSETSTSTKNNNKKSKKRKISLVFWRRINLKKLIKIWPRAIQLLNSWLSSTQKFSNMPKRIMNLMTSLSICQVNEWWNLKIII